MKRGIAAPGFATIVVTDGNVNATTTVTAGQNLLLETPTSDGVFTAVTSVVDPAQFQGVLIAPSTLTGNQAALQATQPGSALVNFSWTDSGGTHQGSVPVNIIAATPSTTSSSVAPWIVAAIAGAAVGALAWHATHPSRVPLSVTATGRARKR